jgi:hypothetical protein
VLVLLAVMTCATAARADVPAHVDIRAAAIAFYADRLLIAARGEVHLRAGSQTIEGNSLRYDLMHNRVLVTGDVRVSTPHGTFNAAVYALDLTTHKATALQLDPLPTTFLLDGDDFSQAVPGPPAQNVFAAEDLGYERPYILSTHASIVPNAHVRFTPARFPTGSGMNVPSPSYLYSFAPNPNFFVPPASLPAFSFDQPYELLGSAHSLLAGHLRYGTSSGASLGIDEHLVDGLQRYLVASYLLRGERFDLGGFEQITPHVTQTLSGSLGNGINSGRYMLQDTSSLLTTTLITNIFEGDNSDDLLLNSATLPVGHILSYKLGVDYGVDSIVNPYTLDIRKGLTASLFTPSVRGPLGTSISGQYVYAPTAYDYAHETGSSTALVSLSRVLHSTLFYASTSFSQAFNRYGIPPPSNYSLLYTTASLAQIYTRPSLPPTPKEASWWGLFPTLSGYVDPATIGYDGVSTFRTYYASAAINPNPNFNLLVSLTGTRDFPQFDGYGRPPLMASFDLRLRPVPNLAVEYGRSYLFGWDLQHWTPQYTLSISP